MRAYPSKGGHNEREILDEAQINSLTESLPLPLKTLFSFQTSRHCATIAIVIATI